ncbi:ubiquinol oxidase subunit II [Undibacterium oligocarboniphilum]|uniref:Ubiquinol oxidase subunit 2 n=1 Tax=Undibacterium oligocarboniphilum TaxID=666702 RepID=A0A850QHL1_9BURK|nr:ubiquinol oxidase subunit II [Undibacterium oligocarboniphilum]MBC3868903.1 ubiquinol oxidase subunit II [Undibacterium oligocarboniphilum]NVO76883.1 ubiquinol oxidase subunit II [Undibacterium oligocarboniphilum]
MISLLARRGLLLLCVALLAGCDTIVLNPSGDIAAQQSKLIVVSTLLMLLIIIPVILLTLFFAWRYRQSNTTAKYDPEWDHSTMLELIIWGAPLLIIIALGMLTWISTHTLDPYRKLSRLDENRAIPAGTKPLVVEVVALDWKWLFIYPEQGVATVNELVTPVDVPVSFKITASTYMNSLYIPALAGQIYAMPGMQTELNAVINKAGTYDGFSANYSGAGFSDMRFKFYGKSRAGFDAWVQSAKSSKLSLNRTDYLELEKPSIKNPVRLYGSVDSDLYHAILNRCVGPDQVCMDKLMSTDMNVKPEQSARGKVVSILAQNQQSGLPGEVCTTPPVTNGK